MSLSPAEPNRSLLATCRRFSVDYMLLVWSSTCISVCSPPQLWSFWVTRYLPAASSRYLARWRPSTYTPSRKTSRNSKDFWDCENSITVSSPKAANLLAPLTEVLKGSPSTTTTKLQWSHSPCNTFISAKLSLASVAELAHHKRRIE